MNLEINDLERDVLLLAVARSFAAGEHPTTNRELMVKLTALTEPPDVPPLDVSDGRNTYCAACGVDAPNAEFKHKPGCAWVARYRPNYRFVP